MMQNLPAFPLQILPLPGEVLPLHIFEPRYRQLLTDAEEKDIEFVTCPSVQVNPKGYGSILKLEQVIRRFPSGESDIVVRAQDFCIVTELNPFFKQKLYPGASIVRQNCDLNKMAGIALVLEFSDWQRQLKKSHHGGVISVHHIAANLHLDLEDRIKYAGLSENAREKFLVRRIQYEQKLLEVAENSKRIFHLN